MLENSCDDEAGNLYTVSQHAEKSEVSRDAGDHAWSLEEVYMDVQCLPESQASALRCCSAAFLNDMM